MRAYFLLLIFFSVFFIGCQSNPGSVKQALSTASQDKNNTPAKPYSYLKLQTLEGRDTLLSSLMRNKASVFIFLAPDCPLSQSYTLTLNELSKIYLKNNILFYGIFPGTMYCIEKIKYFRQKYLIEFPILLDTNYTLTHLCNATITPEAFVIDSTGTILYSGRIDNWAYEVSKKRAQITEHDLQDALESIVNNKPIAVAKTKAVGCFIEVPKK